MRAPNSSVRVDWELLDVPGPRALCDDDGCESPSPGSDSPGNDIVDGVYCCNCSDVFEDACGAILAGLIGGGKRKLADVPAATTFFPF